MIFLGFFVRPPYKHSRLPSNLQHQTTLLPITWRVEDFLSHCAPHGPATRSRSWDAHTDPSRMRCCHPYTWQGFSDRPFRDKIDNCHASDNRIPKDRLSLAW